MLCVLSMVCIIGSILFPNVILMTKKDNLDVATERLINDLKYAKMYAITKNISSISLRFIPDEKEEKYYEYEIYNPSNVSNMVMKKVKLPEGIYISKYESTFANDKVTFDVDGTISPGACSIVLREQNSDEKRKITLTIGFTRIMEVN
jgi:Tfp pilus assembly protein FimT